MGTSQHRRGRPAVDSDRTGHVAGRGHEENAFRPPLHSERQALGRILARVSRLRVERDLLIVDPHPGQHLLHGLGFRLHNVRELAPATRAHNPVGKPFADQVGAVEQSVTSIVHLSRLPRKRPGANASSQHNHAVGMRHRVGSHHLPFERPGELLGDQPVAKEIQDRQTNNRGPPATPLPAVAPPPSPKPHPGGDQEKGHASRIDDRREDLYQ